MLRLSPSLDPKAFIIAIISLLLFWALWQWRKTFPTPTLFFSKVSSFKEVVLNTSSSTDLDSKKSFALKKSRWPLKLKLLSLNFLLLAFINPFFIQPKNNVPPAFEDMPTASSIATKHPKRPISTAVEGIAMYLVLDQSGSMNEKIFSYTPEGQETLSTKMDLLKQVTDEFIFGNEKLDLKGRYNDLLGLISFARIPQVLAPLTLDHNTILEELHKIQVVSDRDLDGTAIGYAIYKTTSLISATRLFSQELIKKGEKSPYEIKSGVIILVTDGFQNPNPLDKGDQVRTIGIEEAAQYAKEQNIKLYIINVDPRLNEDEFSPHRNLMQRSAELTGGKFFVINDNTSLKSIYNSIDQLEKTTFPFSDKIEISREQKQRHGYDPSLYDRILLYSYLIILSLICLLSAICIETLVLRKIP